jgi:hypothetical protein
MSIYDRQYDVVVAGGGPSGVAAAIAAARNHASVLLIERYGFLGGMATNASVPVFCPYSDGEKAVIRGIGLEILEAMRKQAWDEPVIEENNGLHELDWVPIDPEILKRVLDELVLESGCQVLFHTFVEDVKVEKGKVTEINVVNKEGQFKIQAKIFIDCTGDADMVAKAGGEFEYGDENGLVQGVTLCFRLAGVDSHKFLQYRKDEEETGNLTVAVNKARKNGEFPFPEKDVATFKLQHKNIAGLNFGHVFEINPLKAEDLTRAEMEARKKIPDLIRFLNKYVPGLEDAVLTSSGPFIGLRESRRIVGEYRLTKKDYTDRALFEDTIARYAYPIDIHSSSAKGIVTENEKNDFYTSKYKTGESYGIPYRALLPKGLENVMVAGRTLSADRAMHGSFRVMPCCFATGQAAGTAASICCSENKALRNIPITKLQEVLRMQGAYI